MNHLKIGIHLASLGLPLRQALREAQRLGVRGVQIDVGGALSPHTLTQTGRVAFRRLLRSHNLELTALGCPMRQGLDSPEDQQQRIEHTKAVLGLSLDLGARIATVNAGRVPEEADDPRAELLTEALRVLGRHGDHIGAVLALETGRESGMVLGTFLDGFNTGSLGVNLDPANLLLHDFDPRESARSLRRKVVHARATDVRRAATSRSDQEVPVGHGDVNWAHYLDVLEEIDYHGWLTVEHAGGSNRTAGIAAGIDFLKQFVMSPV